MPHRLRVIKGTHYNLPRPESPNPKKYVSLFVQKTTKSEPFAFPLGGKMTSTVTKCPLYRPYATPDGSILEKKNLYQRQCGGRTGAPYI